MDSRPAQRNAHAAFLSMWNSTELLGKVRSSDIGISAESREMLRPMFWRSICSEHDARYFHHHLIQSGIPLPWELDDFLARWLWDEVNHAKGFKILYHQIYGEPFDQIESKLRERKIDFGHIEEFFEDLTSVCTLFAFDELVTTRIYHSSIPFYESLGFIGASEWARRLVFDESQHFSSVMNVMTNYCGDELFRVEGILARIIDVDLQQHSYSGTFVLDHSCPEFPFNRAELMRMCDSAIVRKFSVTARSPSHEKSHQ